jgi:MYXO-CTERM domain-containing protein
MKRVKGTIVGLLLCGSALLAPSARADSADAPECNNQGKTCTTSRVTNGICTYGRCWVCEGDKPMTYSCVRCESADEIAAAGAPSPPTEPEPTCSKKDDSGCTVHQLGSERGIGAMFLALGLGAFFWARRRR